MSGICQAHVPGGMTAARLIAELQKLPGDTPVFCMDLQGGPTEVSEVHFDDEPGWNSKVPYITLR